jgi:hypothetical protein
MYQIWYSRMIEKHRNCKTKTFRIFLTLHRGHSNQDRSLHGLMSFNSRNKKKLRWRKCKTSVSRIQENVRLVFKKILQECGKSV